MPPPAKSPSKPNHCQVCDKPVYFMEKVCNCLSMVCTSTLPWLL
jgi:hypothetical protein